MYDALWVAKTGLDAQQTRMSTIANNLANVNTTAFKRDRALFEDLLYQTVEQSGALSSEGTELPTGITIGTGVRVVATEKLHVQGNLTATDNDLDIAIQGRGYFAILQPDGTQAYTRDGTFRMNSQGQLVNASGFLLQPALSVPNGVQSITIGVDGVVTVQTAGSPSGTQIGSIQLTDFPNPTGLQPLGSNLYGETASSGGPQTGTPASGGLGSLSQGMLETSNVNVVEELVNMIEAQRAYEMNSKAIKAADDMLQFATQTL